MFLLSMWNFGKESVRACLIVCEICEIRLYVSVCQHWIASLLIGSGLGICGFFLFLLVALSKFDADVCSPNCMICVNGDVRFGFNVNYCILPAVWAYYSIEHDRFVQFFLASMVAQSHSYYRIWTYIRFVGFWKYAFATKWLLYLQKSMRHCLLSSWSPGISCKYPVQRPMANPTLWA